MKRLLVSLGLGASLASGAALAAERPAVAALQTSLRSYALGAIEFEGLRRLAPGRVQAVTGLQVNTMVTQRDVEAASARLLDTGLFRSVSHRYRMIRYSLVVTFVLEEAVWNTPIVFDNFLGYEEKELRRAIERRVPGFLGLAPEAPVVLERIANAVRERVKADAPGAGVDYVLVSGAKGVPAHYRFTLRVPGRTKPICGFDFEGFTSDQVEEARAVSARLVGADYSHDLVQQHVLRSLLPIWRREGRYLAKVTGTTVTLTRAADTCAEGARVLVKVDPGRHYIWGGFDWPPTTAMTTDELRKGVGVEAGEPANEDLVDERLSAVEEQYRRRGYLGASVTADKQVNEARGVVTCRVRVFEGPRFRFRNLDVIGLEPQLAARVRERWSLPAGQFYDGHYARAFMKEVRDAERGALAGRTVVTIRERPDAATGTVDVVMEFGR